MGRALLFDKPRWVPHRTREYGGLPSLPEEAYDTMSDDSE